MWLNRKSIVLGGEKDEYKLMSMLIQILTCDQLSSPKWPGSPLSQWASASMNFEH